MVFMQCLNKFRTNHSCTMSSQINYDNLCELMLIVLDEAYKDLKVDQAMTILVFSNNFYIENKTKSLTKSKTYLQHGIAHHKLWYDMKFWERAIYETIKEELNMQKTHIEKDKSNLKR